MIWFCLVLTLQVVHGNLDCIWPYHNDLDPNEHDLDLTYDGEVTVAGGLSDLNLICDGEVKVAEGLYDLDPNEHDLNLTYDGEVTVAGSYMTLTLMSMTLTLPMMVRSQ